MHRTLALLVFALTLSPAVHAEPQVFEAQRLSDHVKILASDEFEGRGPGTAAETRTVNYIVEHFKAAGLEPAGDMVNGKRVWTQSVPMLKADIVDSPSIRLSTSDGASRLDQGKQIVVAAREQAGHTTIVVENEGEEISAELLPSLFDRFFRADKSRTRADSDSVGLGLSITQAIMVAHGGQISVESSGGKTRFVLTFPRQPSQARC